MVCGFGTVCASITDRYAACTWPQTKGMGPSGRVDGISVRKIIILAGKVYTVILALGFFFSFVGLASSIAGACSLPCDMLCHQPSGRLTELGQPHGCSYGGNEFSCDVSRGCCSHLPELAVVGIPGIENAPPADLPVDTRNVSSFLDFPMAHGNVVWTLATGPPVPLFLLSLSLLC